jgi:hypothetical protein
MSLELAARSRSILPWDALVSGGKLYVAMAGPHQLWVIDPVTRLAGSLCRKRSRKSYRRTPAAIGARATERNYN